MKLTKAQAKELSIKKWEYIVNNKGENNGLIKALPELKDFPANCGYCEKYPPTCRGCPISYCLDGLHPYKKWSKRRTKANAQKVLDLIKQS